jgi:signal transduction histidine kinase
MARSRPLSSARSRKNIWAATAFPALRFSPQRSLLDRNALREIARLIDVAAEFDGEMIGEELERDDGQDGADEIGDFRDGDAFGEGSVVCRRRRNLLVSSPRIARTESRLSRDFSMNWLKLFMRQRRSWIVAEMAVAVLVIGLLDFVTGFKVRLLPFYAGPVFVIGWFCRRRAAVAAALISGVIWWCANWFSGDPDLHSWVLTWEIFRHVGFFVIVALTGSALRSRSDMAAARIALLEHSRRLEREIVNISDDEQRRIGQDLHDGLCQYLAALTCSATSLRDDLKKLNMPEQVESAAELAALLQDAVVQTRDLSRGLVPAHVGQVGLVIALESLAQSVSRLQGITCTFKVHGGAPKCDEHAAMHLYRIAQEAINNATKHGKAKRISLSLETADDLMTLRIRDDGVGIPAAKSDGMGLAIMRYRARLNGGELTVDQPAEGGTLISCTAKLSPEESESAAA